jgi:hypothetical protein
MALAYPVSALCARRRGAETQTSSQYSQIVFRPERGSEIVVLDRALGGFGLSGVSAVRGASGRARRDLAPDANRQPACNQKRLLQRRVAKIRAPALS